jgi:hypothetical protein
VLTSLLKIATFKDVLPLGTRPFPC